MLLNGIPIMGVHEFKLNSCMEKKLRDRRYPWLQTACVQTKEAALNCTKSFSAKPSRVSMLHTASQGSQGPAENLDAGLNLAKSKCKRQVYGDFACRLRRGKMIKMIFWEFFSSKIIWLVVSKLRNDNAIELAS